MQWIDPRRDHLEFSRVLQSSVKFSVMTETLGPFGLSERSGLRPYRRENVPAAIIKEDIERMK